jgi:hypothetical protein
MGSLHTLPTRTAAWLGLTLSLVISISPSPARAATEDDSWRFAFEPMFWAAGLSGSTSFGDRAEADIDASFGDILENLDMALMGRFELRKGKIGFGTDLFWVNLGVNLGDPIVGDPEADVRQTLVEGFAFYRLGAWEGSAPPNSGFVDIVAGARYNSVRTRLQGDNFETDQTNMDWIDAFGGLRAYLPLGARFGIYGYGDIGGLGSKLAWATQADLGYRISDTVSLLAGYRVYDADYEDDSGVVTKEFECNLHGPLLGAVLRW